MTHYNNKEKLSLNTPKLPGDGKISVWHSPDKLYYTGHCAVIFLLEKWLLPNGFENWPGFGGEPNKNRIMNPDTLPHCSSNLVTSPDPNCYLWTRNTLPVIFSKQKRVLLAISHPLQLTPIMSPHEHCG